MTAIARMPSRAGIGGMYPLLRLAPGNPMLPLEHGSVGRVRARASFATLGVDANYKTSADKLHVRSIRFPPLLEKKTAGRALTSGGSELIALDARTQLAQLREAFLERRV